MAVHETDPTPRNDESTPIFGIKIPPGYRDWRLISVAHEEGNLNGLRAILGITPTPACFLRRVSRT